MIEQTRDIVRSFNHAYQTDILVEPEGYYPENENAGRLAGLDGNAKMSKSLNNGIFISDDADTVQKKVMSMYTDPDHVRVEDPGKIEGNMVFHYLDVFGAPEDAATIAEMKAQYGGVARQFRVAAAQRAFAQRLQRRKPRGVRKLAGQLHRRARHLQGRRRAGKD